VSIRALGTGHFLAMSPPESARVSIRIFNWHTLASLGLVSQNLYAWKKHSGWTRPRCWDSCSLRVDSRTGHGHFWAMSPPDQPQIRLVGWFGSRSLCSLFGSCLAVFSQDSCPDLDLCLTSSLGSRGNHHSVVGCKFVIHCISACCLIGVRDWIAQDVSVALIG